ncbi:hypothetical protein H8959_022410 [Pygathrix nigripes]
MDTEATVDITLRSALGPLMSSVYGQEERSCPSGICQQQTDLGSANAEVSYDPPWQTYDWPWDAVFGQEGSHPLPCLSPKCDWGIRRGKEEEGPAGACLPYSEHRHPRELGCRLALGDKGPLGTLNVRTHGAPAPTPAFGIGSRRRWLVLPPLQHLLGSRDPAPAAAAAVTSPAPGCPGLRGESCSAHHHRWAAGTAPANLPGAAVGVCLLARWVLRVPAPCGCQRRAAPAGVPGSFLLARGIIHIWKLQSQQPAGPGGRVQLGGRNFDLRAFCKKAATPHAGSGWHGGFGAGWGRDSPAALQQSPGSQAWG